MSIFFALPKIICIVSFHVKYVLQFFPRFEKIILVMDIFILLRIHT